MSEREPLVSSVRTFATLGFVVATRMRSGTAIGFRIVSLSKHAPIGRGSLSSDRSIDRVAKEWI